MLERIRRFFAGERREAAPVPQQAETIDEDALLAPARAALTEGRTDDALALLEAVTWKQPRVAEAHRLLGELHHRRGDRDEARDSYTLAIHHAPDAWRAHYGLALVCMDEGRFAAAIPELEAAIASGGGSAMVHNSLGAAHAESGDHAGSVEHFRRAIEVDPEFTDAYSNLGYILFRELEQYDEGAALLEKAIELGATRLETRLNWAMVLQQQGHSERALEVYDGMLAADPTLAQVRLNRALILLARGDFADGWADYEARQAIPQYATSLNAAQEWDGSDLEGKSIAIFPEQGIGDEIMFASCIPDVLARARACAIVCNPKLESVFRRSFPRATVRSSTAAPTDAERHADFSVRMGSLPRYLRRTRDDFPHHHGYLHADAARVTFWKERLAALPGRRKVGISWRGGTASTRRGLRSIPLESWLPLLRLVDVDFVSLQYTDCAAEIEDIGRRFGATVHHWAEAHADYDETAALTAALDLVISVQTASVHLAGALGIPAWALIPEIAEWRYGRQGDRMPWYPSVRLIRRQTGETWGDVIERARDLLVKSS